MLNYCEKLEMKMNKINFSLSKLYDEIKNVSYFHVYVWSSDI